MKLQEGSVQPPDRNPLLWEQAHGDERLYATLVELDFVVRWVGEHTLDGTITASDLANARKSYGAGHDMKLRREAELGIKPPIT